MAKTERNIDAHIDRLLHSLSTLQHEGWFDIHTIQETTGKNLKTTADCIFVPTLIAEALYEARGYRKATSIAEEIIDKLIPEKSSMWTWNYWKRASPSSNTHPYPDDLDDTALAISAIKKWRPHALNGFVLSLFTRTLIKNELNPGGPYRTWTIHHSKNDVDLIVNVNIRCILDQLGVHLHELDTYLETTFLTKNQSSQYYETGIVSLYFISKIRNSAFRRKIIRRIRREIEHAYKNQNILYTAMIVCTLIRAQSPTPTTTKAIRNLLDLLGLSILPFRIDPHEKIYRERVLSDKTAEWVVSPAFTMAICAEALCLAKKYLLQHKTKTYAEKTKLRQTQFFEHSVEKVIKSFPKHIQKVCLQQMNELKSTSVWDEIVLLPFHMNPHHQKNRQAGIVSVLSWIAYTLDDTMIDEGIQTKNIAVSRYLHRSIHMHISTFLTKNNGLNNTLGWKNTIQKILDTMDSAQYIEQTNTAFLSEKSLGIVIPFLLLLNALGYSYNHRAVACLKKIFFHYGYARQLSDDAHDWNEDMKHNRQTMVTKMILSHTPTDNLEPTKNDANSTFWNTCAEPIAHTILKHTHSAQRSIKKFKKVLDLRTQASISIEKLNNLVHRYEVVGNTMLTEIQNAKQFLSTYSSNHSDHLDHPVDQHHER